MAIRFLIPAIFVLAALPVRAQVSIPDTLSDRAAFSLITVSPGDAVYSMYGHSALRVVDSATGSDLLFNWGTFDFDEPWFVPRFAYGSLRYYLSVTSVEWAMRVADLERRLVIEQVLDLRRPERDSLYAHLLVNLQPENRYYRYDFLFDNCATRLRDLFEDHVGTSVIWSTDPAGDRTFRELLDPYDDHMPWLDAGINLGLGAAVDRPAEAREAAFLPMLLDDLFAGATIGTGVETRELVVSTDTVFVPPTTRADTTPTDWPLYGGWGLLALVLIVTWWEQKRRKRPKAIQLTDRLVFGIAGVAGIVLAFLVFVSHHDVTAPNWNLLWASPAHLLITLLPGRTPRRPVIVYYGLSALMAVVVLTAPVTLPQVLPAVAYPLAAIIAVRSFRGIGIARRRQPIEWTG